MDAARADDSGGGGRGRFVTFPPLQSLGEGGGRKEGALDRRQTVLFFSRRGFSPISGRDRRGTECGRERMIGCVDFMCWILLCLMQQQGHIKAVFGPTLDISKPVESK